MDRVSADLCHDPRFTLFLHSIAGDKPVIEVFSVAQAQRRETPICDDLRHSHTYLAKLAIY
jgi:hypothetical protein